jgi:hypothetical protein
MKRILLRTLKEIGRLTLIILILLSWSFVANKIGMLFHNELNYCNANNCMSPYIRLSRILSFTGFAIMGTFLFIFIHLKKLSKL